MTALEHPYRGRIAPTPTGFLHLGHANTFQIAQDRARKMKGTIIFRNEDLDSQRCKPEYVQASMDDLKWFGLTWDEGPDVGGPHGPYTQSERLPHYLEIWKALNATGRIYPSPHSRKDVASALSAPHQGDSEIIFPPSLRPKNSTASSAEAPGDSNWRFLVPDGEKITFTDQRVGTVSFTAGQDFGDFIVWRKDGFPSYELAVVADDHAMQISEVVRGEDLLLSTARQILIYQALQWPIPDFYHCQLLTDASGKRLAKRHNALALRTLKEQGETPDSINEKFLF